MSTDLPLDPVIAAGRAEGERIARTLTATYGPKGGPPTIWLVVVVDDIESSNLQDEGGHASRPVAAFTTQPGAEEACRWMSAYRYDSRPRVIPLDLHTLPTRQPNR